MGRIEKLLKHGKAPGTHACAVCAIIALGVPHVTTLRVEERFENKGLLVFEGYGGVDDIYLYLDLSLPHELGSSTFTQTLLGDVLVSYGVLPFDKCLRSRRCYT